MRKYSGWLSAFLAACMLFGMFAVAQASAPVDVAALVQECSTLSGQEAVDFFYSLKDKGLTDTQILQFFIDLPISEANKDIYDLYQKDGFAIYAAKYPSGEAYDGFAWEMGMGSEYVGHFSGWNLKGPYTDYVPLPEGPVGDAAKTYKIGVAFHGMKSAWTTNFHDSIMNEALQHPNVELDIQDAEYDDNKFSNIFDMFIAQGVDGIVCIPNVEAPSAPPIQRATEAGIPVVTVDRVSGYDGYSHRVAGNFTANGAQNAMFLIDTLKNEGSFDCNIVLLRKALGSTADAIRIGYYLKPLSYIPGIKVVASYHDNSDKTVAFTNAQAAVQAHERIDAFMCDGDYQAIVMLEALNLANRLDSRDGGKRVIIGSVDDSKEAIKQVENGFLACNTPYTPMESDIGLRVVLKEITEPDNNMPRDIIVPNIPIVTQDGRELFGMKTLTPADWFQYTFGPTV